MGALVLACIMLGVEGAWGVLYNTEKASRDHIASYYSLMDSDCNGVCWEGHGEGVYSIQLRRSTETEEVFQGYLVKGGA